MNYSVTVLVNYTETVYMEVTGLEVGQDGALTLHGDGLDLVLPDGAWINFTVKTGASL